MNYKVTAYYLGQICKIFSIFLIIPVWIGCIYAEYAHIWTFFISIAVYLALGFGLTIPFKNERKLRNKEALIVVGLAWVLLSVIGCLPFVIDGCIPSFTDALFETISGFTTTGATIVDDASIMPKCMQFWRCFTHWLGGMGILVFILAVMPGTDGSTFQLFKFESPGPQVGKISSKVRITASILYGIYFGFTLLEMLMLGFGGMFGHIEGMDWFNAATLALSTAGTGGFANTGNSIAEFNSVYVEVVVMAFMFIFSLNFNIYYLMLLRHFKIAFCDEELRFYFIYVFLAITLIVIDLCATMGYTFGSALRYTSFTVISLTSSTGFSTAEFTAWPQFAQTILITCMFLGACAGSTGGGFKASRILVLGKAGYAHLLTVLRPQSVQVVRLNGKRFSSDEVRGVVNYFVIYALILVFACLLISLDRETSGFSITFSSVLSCLNNDGPYLAGAFAGYAGFNIFSKYVFMILMLVGRLEIFPMLLLFVPKTWSKRF